MWPQQKCYISCEPRRCPSGSLSSTQGQSDVGAVAAKDFAHRDLEGGLGLPQGIFKVGKPGVFWKKNTYQSKTEDYTKRQLTLLLGAKRTWGL